MKIALFGASGMIGQRVAKEALAHGHEVRAIVRNTANFPLTHPNLTVVSGNILDASSVTQAVAGCDIVVNATRESGASAPDRNEYIDAAHALMEGLPRAGVRRLIVVGGAGSLEVAPGVQLVDTPDFPEAWKPGAARLRDALPVYRTADLDWTFFCPAGLIRPGERTGKFRLGTDQLITNDKGESSISAEDYAVALVDEIEHPRFVRRRFTIGY
jgi:uncharacterized protein